MPIRRKSWERLVRELQDSGYQSEYLDRLRSRLDPWERHEALEAEIAQEVAAALGRSEAKVNHALLELEILGREIDASRPGERAELEARFDLLVERAERARRDLLIHREAAGIRQNAILERLYPIPPRRGSRG